MTRRIRLLTAAVLTAGLLTAMAGPAMGAPVKNDAVIVVDAAGQPIDGTAVLDTPRVDLAAITPVLGSTFDAYIGSVKVHFANAYQWLDRGNSWTFGNSRLSMQTDGNLVIYNRVSGAAKWRTNTAGSGATQMLFQPDDNLVVYTSGYASAPWASDTYNHCTGSEAPLLGLQSDSNFVIYCGYVSSGNLYVRAIWATGTVM